MRDAGIDILEQDHFHDVLRLEQLRAERSGGRFVLMLLDSTKLLAAGGSQDAVSDLLEVMQRVTRATDITGWYRAGEVVGTIFVEIGNADEKSVGKALLSKVIDALTESFNIHHIKHIQISFHTFPDDWNVDEEHLLAEPAFHQHALAGPGRTSIAIKRTMDVVGSAMTLILLFPLMLAIAIVIKLTSKGPVLFRQKRVGQYGKPFTFFKFRSMRNKNDSSAHQAFVKQLITEKKGSSGLSEGESKVHKIQADPRITSVGRILRKSSLDELPQLFNVLVGDMSLVGPRPPIPYEVKHYDIWHRRRLLEVKPGLTGLWQVSGRSRIGFDDMVRLDLKYARTWTIWLDIKILLKTPWVVISGDGAY